MTTSVSTSYEVSADGLLLISQMVVNIVTVCLKLDKGVVRGCWTVSIISL